MLTSSQKSNLLGFYHGGDKLYELKGIRKCARSKRKYGAAVVAA